MLRTPFVSAAITLAFCHSLAAAQQPVGTAFTYQGRLMFDGAPAEGPHVLEFRLYDGDDAGAQQIGDALLFDGLAGNPPPVEVVAGGFSAILDFGPGIFSGDARWLDVRVNGTPLTPRQELTAGPYALFALNALNVTQSVPLTLSGANDTHIISGENASAVSGAGVVGRATAAAGTTYGGRFESASPFGTGVLGMHSSATGSRPGVHGVTNSTVIDAVGVMGEVTSTSPGSASAAVRGLNRGTGEFGIGVYGSQDGSGQGVYGTSVSGRGLYGLATAPTGATYGVYGSSVSTTGTGVFGLANAASGSTYGIHGQSFSTAGTGVLGMANAATGMNYGVYGQTNSASGYGGYFQGRGYFSGNVGIGVTNPNHKLDVGGTAQMTGFRMPTGAAVNKLLVTDGAGVGTWQNLSNAMLPVPMTLTGDIPGSGIFSATNHATSPESFGLRGRVVEAAAWSFGVIGENSSAAGGIGVYGTGRWAGVHGWAMGAGANYGVWGRSDSPAGYGVYGLNDASTGTAGGVLGETQSTTGRGVYGIATNANGASFGLYGVSNGTAGTGVFGVATTSAGIAHGVVGESRSQDGRGVFGTAIASVGTTSGVYGQADSASGRGVAGIATSTTGTPYGVYGQIASPLGIGVQGTGTTATGGVGVQGTAAAIGVRGYSTATTGFTSGGYFECASNQGTAVWGKLTSTAGLEAAAGRFEAGGNPQATGVWADGGRYGGVFETDGIYAVSATNFNTTDAGGGVYAECNSTAGRGVVGFADADTGTTSGVYGEADSTLGRGVFGIADATTGTTFGGRFECASPAGNGVFGYATATTGATVGARGRVDSTAGAGVSGFASAATGSTYGVYGQSNSSTATAYGVWAQGRLGASGTKSFRIDHPADPENKYLMHYSTESPEVLNAYSGTIRLDNAGEAIVELPHYFAHINRDPRYTLTAVGAPMPLLHVAEEIDEASLLAGGSAEPGAAAPRCWFRIAGGQPGARVSWRVEAVRNDRWLRDRGAPIEIEKEDLEKGTYLHPDLYAQPPDRATHNDLSHGTDANIEPGY